MTAWDWNSALGREAPVEFVHVPQPSALSCLCCECRRPQRAATVRCLEWADVYSPPYRVLKDMAWHVAAMQPACLPACLPALSQSLSQEISARRLGNGSLLSGLCLALSFNNTMAGTDTSNRKGFSSGQNNVCQQFTIKRTREVSYGGQNDVWLLTNRLSFSSQLW